MTKSKGFFPILIPSATVFVSSACIMILELVAGRLIARHLGSSLYTWTSVIGVVLAGITIGNYCGGRIADRFPSKKALAVLFGISSVACVTIVILNNLVGQWIFLWHLNWPLRVFTHVSLVFLIPSTLLGTISPVVAKKALDQGLATGRTVGDIYAWGAAGSIAGTFLAGFYLIAAMGTIAIIWTVGAVMLLMAILYWAKLWILYLWAAIFIALMTMGMAPVKWAEKTGVAMALREKTDPDVLYEDESQYCYIAVKRISKTSNRRVFIQDKLRHSEVIIGQIDNLQYFYTKIYAGLTHGLSQNKQKLNVMVIGGGGYVYPQYIEKNWPGSRIDVVEIDPGVTKAAYEAFGLDPDTTINTIAMDARNYVDELLEQQRNGIPIPKYDFIYEDAINDYSVPFQLVTQQFNDKIADILTDDGVYMVNLIDTYDNGRFLGAVVNTLQKTFPYVYVISSYVNLPSLRDTFVVVCCKHSITPERIFEKYDKNLKLRYLEQSDIEYLKGKSSGIILTDDYAPVENLLAPVVRQSAKEIFARKHLRQAKNFKQLKQWQQSIEKYKKALALNPSMSIKAYNEIALIYVTLGDMEKAAWAFQSAIDYHKNTKAQQNIIGTIHYNLGTVLQKMNNPGQAKQQFLKAIEQFKIELEEGQSSALLWTRLGDCFATIGDFKSASKAFGKALALDPGNLLYYDNMVKSLQYQGRLQAAIEVLKRGIDFMMRNNKINQATKLKKNMEILEYQYKLQKQK